MVVGSVPASNSRPTPESTDLQAVRDANPDLSPDEAAIETASSWPSVDRPSALHRRAVDVILRDGDNEVPMGCGLNEQCEQMRTGYEDLAPTERKNRRLLVEAMESVGFVNHGHEWWHFSYGDRYWAVITGTDVAIYGGL